MTQGSMATVIYHADCADGFGAAWVAWRTFGEGARYVPARYGDAPPDLDAGDEVYILDFAYPRQATVEMSQRCAFVTVLDHHRSAAEDFAALDGSPAPPVPRNLVAIFGTDRSGAMLAWEHFHGCAAAAPLVRYVQDRDLWCWQLPYSREVSAWLSSYPADFAAWSRLNAELFVLSDRSPAVVEGEGILRAQLRDVQRMCERVRIATLGGCAVPVVNATVHASEVAEELLVRFPTAPFAACYVDRADGRRQWSLRSVGDFDVSAVAKVFGGGGHKNAAGFLAASRFRWGNT